MVRTLRFAALAALMLLLLLQAATPSGACSMPDPFHPISGSNMYAAADLVAIGYYANESVVELVMRTNHSNDILYEVVNSTFTVKDAIASNSSALGRCFPSIIVIRVVVVNGCVNRRFAWRPDAQYAVVLRALNESGGYYELFEEGYQVPFTELTDNVTNELRSVACGGNATCIALHPSLCRAARLAPTAPGGNDGENEQQPPTVPQPTDMLPPQETSEETGAAAEQDGRGNSGDDVTSTGAAKTSTARTTAAVLTSAKAPVIAETTRPRTASQRSGGGAAQPRSTTAPIAALAAVAAAMRWWTRR